MPESRPWHEDDAFWETWGPMMFSERRLSNTPADVDSILSLLGVESGAQILDLCCGPGRHSLELARRGFQVTGVDRTKAYLDRATEQAREEGLDVEFVQEDMRTFCRPDAFDAAINMFTSFGYFEDPEDDRWVVTNVCRSLKAGGVLLMDMHGKETLARIFQPRVWDEQDGVLLLQERHVTDNWSWMENRWIVLSGDKRTEFLFSHRLYSATEIVSLLTGRGFASADVYGSLDGSPYDHTARRLVAVARK